MPEIVERDMAMEVLAILPKMPCRATFADICDDLGIDARELRQNLSAIEAHGIFPQIWPDRDGQWVVGVKYNDWQRAQSVVEAYLSLRNEAV